MFMFMTRSLLTRAILLSVYTTLSSAQSQPLSCADVDCPVLGNTAISNCTVAGASYPIIGLASVQHTPGPTLDWTIAVNQSRSGNTSIVNRAFYLGVSSTDDLDQGTHSTCSLFFTSGDNGPLFYDPHTPIGTDCMASDGRAGFTSKCISDLISQVKGLATSNAGLCRSIADTLVNSPPSSCSLPSSTNITTVFLGGAEAYTGAVPLQPISAEANKTSACWPTLPKSNQLIPVWTASIHTNDTDDGVVEIAAGTTPIMTISFDGGGENGEESSVEMICLRPVDLNDKSIQTSDDGTSGAQGSKRIDAWLALLAIICSGIVCLI